ncbi:SDR family NAD(P)-dependent oxidoreductase [Streptomyces sp. NPDC059355]|uniref:SDR family NAD(P)-dependent oxidoreductase n=1 Tax=Streptomyces sp. NPDC059355 TaxID=3346811 RepID=UPI00367B8A7A
MSSARSWSRTPAARRSAAGHAVTVVGRDPDRGARAVERINATGPAHPARFLAADLASLEGVRVLADRVAAEHAASGEPLNVQVNNVGSMFADRRSLGGVEASFVVNHLSPHLPTELLLPTLTAAAPSRIVNVTSAAVGVAKRVFDNVEPPGGYYGLHWHGRAKLANLACTLDLAARLDATGVSVFAADPASVAARPSIVAATGSTLTGRTGLVIGARATLVAPFRGGRPTPASPGPYAGSANSTHRS